MDNINIQIEPCKTYFSDGCVESAKADETDLLNGDLKLDSIEPVSILPSCKNKLCYYFMFIHFFVFID